ncbi:MAG: hypothetical protein AABZ60_20700, partial [Planctomycetota bacterium]
SKSSFFSLIAFTTRYILDGTILRRETEELMNRSSVKSTNFFALFVNKVYFDLGKYKEAVL